MHDAHPSQSFLLPNDWKLSGARAGPSAQKSWWPRGQEFTQEERHSANIHRFTRTGAIPHQLPDLKFCSISYGWGLAPVKPPVWQTCLHIVNGIGHSDTKAFWISSMQFETACWQEQWRVQSQGCLILLERHPKSQHMEMHWGGDHHIHAMCMKNKHSAKTATAATRRSWDWRKLCSSGSKPSLKQPQGKLPSIMKQEKRLHFKVMGCGSSLRCHFNNWI